MGLNKIDHEKTVVSGGKIPIDRQAYIEMYGVDDWNSEYDKQESRWKSDGIYPKEPFNIYILRDRRKSTTTSRDYDMYRTDF